MFYGSVKLQLYAQVLYMRICKAISVRINLYHTILVLHNNYACSATPTSSHTFVQACIMDVCSTFDTLHFNQCPSASQIVVQVMALLHFLINGLLANNQKKLGLKIP